MEGVPAHDIRLGTRWSLRFLQDPFQSTPSLWQWTTSVSLFPISIVLGLLRKRLDSTTSFQTFSLSVSYFILFYFLPCFLICIYRHINKRNFCGFLVKIFHTLGSNPVRKRSNVGSLVMNQECSFKTEKTLQYTNKSVGKNMLAGWILLKQWIMNIYIKVIVSG